MTPADFDRPYVDEATERFVDQSRPEPARQETRHEPQPADEAPRGPIDNKPADDKPADERKRGGWWKRVLS